MSEPRTFLWLGCLNKCVIENVHLLVKTTDMNRSLITDSASSHCTQMSLKVQDLYGFFTYTPAHPSRSRT